MTTVTIGLLGPVAVDTGDGMQTVPGARARRFARSARRRTRGPRSSRALIETVWDDAPPQSPAGGAAHPGLPPPTGASRRCAARRTLGTDCSPTRSRRTSTAPTSSSTPGHPRPSIRRSRCGAGRPATTSSAPLADSVRSRADDLRRRIDFRRAEVPSRPGTTRPHADCGRSLLRRRPARRDRPPAPHAGSHRGRPHGRRARRLRPNPTRPVGRTRRRPRRRTRRPPRALLQQRDAPVPTPTPQPVRQAARSACAPSPIRFSAATTRSRTSSRLSRPIEW